MRTMPGDITGRLIGFFRETDIDFSLLNVRLCFGCGFAALEVGTISVTPDMLKCSLFSLCRDWSGRDGPVWEFDLLWALGLIRWRRWRKK